MSNCAIAALGVAQGLVAVGVVVVIGVVLYRRWRSDEAYPVRRVLFRIGVGLVVAWIAASAAVYGRLPGTDYILAVPVALTTWPAYQAALEVAGFGHGANAVLPLDGMLMALVSVWCVVLWSPLLSIRVKRIPIPVALGVQVLAIGWLCVYFWKYGNG